MMQPSRSNNFDFVRLLAAGVVLCGHQFAVCLRPEPSPFGLITLGTLGVLIFFSISGYLVAQSWVRDPHVLRFASKRFLRIWPGLAVVTFVAAFVIGPAVTSLSLPGYFGSPATWGYLTQLYLNIKYVLPGVFEHNPVSVVNGSLWTIPIEVRWYGVLLVAGIFGLLHKKMRFALLLGVVLYAIYIYGIFDVQHNPRAAFLRPDFGCEYGSYFCYGVLMNSFREEWHRYRLLLAGLLSGLAVLLAAAHHGYAAIYALLPFLVIWFGTSSTPVLRDFGRYGDFSYGIYIYAFMVQQFLISILGIDHSYWAAVSASAVCTLGLAVVSWHFVEAPAMTLKRHLGRGDAGRLGMANTPVSPASLPPAVD
ncbi:hypothetical protein B0E46_05920 [Rhodanobacter sp. B04]|nr:hypothetical protein B0E46_05920 [Rhodanobacter sp. B04]